MFQTVEKADKHAIELKNLHIILYVICDFYMGLRMKPKIKNKCDKCILLKSCFYLDLNSFA